MADFSSIQHGLLPRGTVTTYGTIVSTSYTAYQMDDGSYVPFLLIHGAYKAAFPLVTLREG